MTNPNEQGLPRVRQLIHLEAISRGTTGRCHNKLTVEIARLQYSAIRHGELPTETVVMRDPHLTGKRREERATAETREEPKSE